MAEDTAGTKAWKQKQAWHIQEFTVAKAHELQKIRLEHLSEPDHVMPGRPL